MSAGPGATMRAVLALVAERPRRRCALARLVPGRNVARVIRRLVARGLVRVEGDRVLSGVCDAKSRGDHACDADNLSDSPHNDRVSSAQQPRSIALYLSPDVLDALDAVAAEAGPGGTKASRSAVARAALARGLAELAAEARAKAPATRAAA